MEEIKNKSLKGELIKVIVRSLVIDDLYEMTNCFKNNLISRLENNLKFKTDVSCNINEDDTITGVVSFINENGLFSTVAFNISNSLLTV